MGKFRESNPLESLNRVRSGSGVNDVENDLEVIRVNIERDGFLGGVLRGRVV